MTSGHDVRPVVVGIDGSAAALDAALWAVDEAQDREAPLRLVHAIGVARDRSIPFSFYEPEIRYAESTLRAASSAVAATGKAVKVESDVCWAPPDDALIAESRDAEMICVGSVGIGGVPGRFVGSTAASAATNARCPVVVVRRRPDTDVRGPAWVVVGIDDRADDDRLIAHAVNEARLRNAPVLAVGTAADAVASAWRRDNPDTPIYPICTDGGLPRFLAENAEECVQLAIVGAANGEQMHCSVMVVR